MSSKRVDWPAIRYGEVRGYIYNLDGQTGVPIVKNGRLDNSVLNSNGARLTASQVERLLNAVAQPHPKHPVMRCYFPRHAFVFYDGASRPVAFLEICFECFGYRTSPPLSHFFDLKALNQLCRDVGLPILQNARDYQTLKKRGQNSP